MLDSVANAAKINVLMVDDLFENGVEPGDHILVVGGDQIGLQTADYGIDTIVFASERRSNRRLAEVANSKGYKTYVVGDAFDVVSEDSGTIFANIAQAHDIARQI